MKDNEFGWMEGAYHRDGSIYACLFVALTAPDRYEAGKAYMREKGYAWHDLTLEEELALPDYEGEGSDLP